MHVTILDAKTFENMEPSASTLEMDTLLEAIFMRNPFLVRKLIKSNSVDINYQFLDHLNGTLLHVAAIVGSLDIVKILVEEGHADINMTDDLDEARCTGQLEITTSILFDTWPEKGSRDIEDVEFLLKPVEKTFRGDVC